MFFSHIGVDIIAVQIYDSSMKEWTERKEGEIAIFTFRVLYIYILIYKTKRQQPFDCEEPQEEEWCIDCEDLSMFEYLKADSLNAAKKEALEIIRKELDRLNKEFEELTE